MSHLLTLPHLLFLFPYVSRLEAAKLPISIRYDSLFLLIPRGAGGFMTQWDTVGQGEKPA